MHDKEKFGVSSTSYCQFTVSHLNFIMGNVWSRFNSTCLLAGFMGRIRVAEQLPSQQESWQSTTKRDLTNLLLLQGLMVKKVFALVCVEQRVTQRCL